MAKNGFLRNTPTDLKGVTIVILKNYASVPVRTKRLSLSNKARRKASRNKLVEELIGNTEFENCRK